MIANLGQKLISPARQSLPKYRSSGIPGCGGDPCLGRKFDTARKLCITLTLGAWHRIWAGHFNIMRNSMQISETNQFTKTKILGGNDHPRLGRTQIKYILNIP